ncbi:glutaredoxin family protein [Neisseria sp. SLRRB23]|uniref:glutaredoxin family protein n=1 Tax=Neisseria sp. SLRRB23 TaxID=3435199 RepID=UPI003D7F1EAF
MYKRQDWDIYWEVLPLSRIFIPAEIREEKYNELIPVLLAGDEEICHWFLDEDRLKQFLER